MKKVQLLLIVALISMLSIAPALASTTIELSGNIEPAAINVGLDKSQLILDIAPGDTSASDDLTIVNTSLIPLKVSLVSISHKADTWSPEMTTSDVATFSLADAQNKAKFRFESISDNAYRTPSFTEVAPVGTGSNNFATFSAGSWGTPTAGEVNLGAIDASADGIAEVSSTLTGTLEASNKRILSKVFEAEMVLNFSAEE